MAGSPAFGQLATSRTLPENGRSRTEELTKYSGDTTTSDAYYSVEHPALYVLDPDGNFPLNLQRDGLATEGYPFERELVDEIVKDFLAWLLVNTPSCPEHGLGTLARDFPGLRSTSFGKAFLHREGVSILDPWVISQMPLRHAIYLASDAPGYGSYTDHDAQFAASIYDELEFLIDCVARKPCTPVALGKAKVMGARAVVSEELAEELDLAAKEKRYSDRSITEREKRDMVIANYHIEKRSNVGLTIATFSCPPTRLTKCIPTKSRSVVAVELFCEEAPAPAAKLGVVGRIRKDIIKLPFIPYDYTRRRTLLADAFRELQELVDLHESRLRASQ